MNALLGLVIPKSKSQVIGGTYLRTANSSIRVQFPLDSPAIKKSL